MLTKLFQTFGWRARVQVRLVVMAEEEKVARFGEIPGSRVWSAVMAELDEFIVGASDDLVDEVDANKLFKVAGGQEYLLEFKRRLLLREAAAHGRGPQKETKETKDEESEE